MSQQIGINTCCVLAADFPATSNTVLANVTGMSFPAAAKSKYCVEMRLPFNLVGTAGGFKFEVLAPATPTYFLQNYFVIADDATVTIENSITAPASVGNTLANAGNHVLVMYVYVETTVAGTVQLQWAQNVSDASASTLQKGGIMKILQVQ
jgi:hypothetical protein